jgi:acetyl esterase/lipase
VTSAELERAAAAYEAYGKELRGAPTLEAARAAFERAAAEYPLAADVVCESATADGVDVEWVGASGDGEEPVVVVIHGGGFASGSIATHRALAANIAHAAGGRALVVGYRLAPEHPFPAGLDDAVCTYRWLLERGTPPGRVVLLGDSAGGGLALAALVAFRRQALRLPAGVVMIGPWVDLTVSGESMTSNADNDAVVSAAGLRGAARTYLGDVDPLTPAASPLYAALSGLPPVLIQVGSRETLLDDARRLAARAREAGLDVDLQVWDGLMHCWHQYAHYLPEARAAIESIGKFARQVTGATAP